MWKEAIQIEDKNAKEVIIKLMQKVNELEREVKRLKREKLKVPMLAIGQYREFDKVRLSDHNILFRKGKYPA